MLDHKALKSFYSSERGRDFEHTACTTEV